MNRRISILASAVAGALGGAVITGTILLNAASAADKEESAAPPATVTIYIGEGGTSVKKMNEEHNKYFAQGYRFASMVSHDENNDHKGVWITYVRQ